MYLNKIHFTKYLDKIISVRCWLLAKCLFIDLMCINPKCNKQWRMPSRVWRYSTGSLPSLQPSIVTPLMPTAFSGRLHDNSTCFNAFGTAVKFRGIPGNDTIKNKTGGFYTFMNSRYLVWLAAESITYSSLICPLEEFSLEGAVQIAE